MWINAKAHVQRIWFARNRWPDCWSKETVKPFSLSDHVPSITVIVAFLANHQLTESGVWIKRYQVNELHSSIQKHRLGFTEYVQNLLEVPLLQNFCKQICCKKELKPSFKISESVTASADGLWYPKSVTSNVLYRQYPIYRWNDRNIGNTSINIIEYKSYQIPQNLIWYWQ